MILKRLDGEKTDSCRAAARIIAKAMLPLQRKDIAEWAEETIDLSFDHSSAANGPVRLKPYQIEPLRAIDDTGIREVTLMWGQRLGKSTMWKFGLLKRVADGGCSGLVVYPNMELGEQSNRDTLMPLLETLPEARRDLLVRGAKNKDSYHIPSQQSLIYFRGAGTQIVSVTANFCVLDECDFVNLQKSGEESQNVEQIKAVRLRMQTFRQRMLVASSSPTNEHGTIYRNWHDGSRGKWHLRCLECGALYPSGQLAYLRRDGSFAGLQWRKDADGKVIADSIRWICPKCGHEHGYEDAWEMNAQGMYVHTIENALHRSFQCGALAAPDLWTWQEVAETQERATDPDGKKFLYNTVLGMPFQFSRSDEQRASIREAIRSKQSSYPADLAARISVICAGIDQQKSELAGEKYYVCVVRAWDEDGNSWLLKSSTLNSLGALGELMDAEYCGRRIDLALIDQGGFSNEQDLTPFVEARVNAFFYKGEDDRTLKGRPWMASTTQRKLFLANAVKYQVALLGLMYDPPRASGYAWQLPENVGAEYFKQVESVQPNTRMSKDNNGEAYQNWCVIGSGRRDYFDAEKMALVALDLACHYIAPEKFGHGNKPLFKRKEWLNEALRQKQMRRSMR